MPELLFVWFHHLDSNPLTFNQMIYVWSNLPFAIQEYSDSENPGLFRKNTMDVLEKS